MRRGTSEYERQEKDFYPTPNWVTDVLYEVIAPHIRGKVVWEPACGTGQMVNALRAHGLKVMASDVMHYPGVRGMVRFDFLRNMMMWESARPHGLYDAIITNPPYGPNGRTAVAFIQRALSCKPATTAFLLNVDFDSAAGRVHLFKDCRSFAGKIVLNKRIEWFPRAPDAAGPSANHAWFIWHLSNRQPPRIWYGP